MRLAATNPEFPVCSGIGIVCVQNWFSTCETQLVSNREISPVRHVGWFDDHSLFNVHRSGCTQADCLDGILIDSVFFCQAPNGQGYSLNGIFRAFFFNRRDML